MQEKGKGFSPRKSQNIKPTVDQCFFVLILGFLRIKAKQGETEEL